MKRVLIVDDDRWFAESVGRGLRKKYRVAAVGSAEEVFPAIAEFKPDFLLLDLILGEKNAVTFLNEFISYDDLGHVKIIVLSSVARDISREDLTRLGVEEVLDKAECTPEALLAALGSLR
jgi:CheY-like chemotaxis protein